MASTTVANESSALFGTGSPAAGASTIPLPQILGLAGSVILFIGVFTPIISLPIVGGMNYFQNGRGDGVIVLLVAILSAFLTLAKRYRFLLFTGGGPLAILALTFIVFQVRISQMQTEMKKSMGNNPFAGLGDAMMNSVQISWGWAVLIIGAVLLIAAALVHRRETTDGEYENSVFPNIADKHVYIALGVIFAIWLGLIGYGFLGGSAVSPSVPVDPLSALQSKSPAKSSSTSTETPSMSPEEAAYISNVAVGKVEVGKTILDEPGVFGELKNNGDKVLNKVEITIYFLDAQGNPVSEKKYTPVNEGAQNFGMSDTSALKPRYSRKFGYKADEAPSDWSKKVRVEVSKVGFAE
jgi:uncharacterized membrane protein YidH (DUF202 family)